jgi:nucleotide-binding universal stress UspA family protein
VLLRVANSSYQDYGQSTSVTPPPPLDARDAERARHEAHRYLTALADRPVLAGIDVEVRVESGPVATTILDVAQDRAADIVVMSSHGRTSVARWVLGSVAQKVARHAAVPVVVVPRSGGHTVLTETGMQRVPRALVALDGSPLAEAAVVPGATVIAALAAPMRAELHLIKILRATSRAVSAAPGAEGERGGAQAPSAEEAAHEYLGGMVERLRKGPLEGLDVSVTWSIAHGDDVAAALVAAAERAPIAVGAEPIAYDLLAMATHGRGGLARWATGSVTERVLESATLPLLVVHSRLPAAPAPSQPRMRADPTSAEFPPLY